MEEKEAIKASKVSIIINLVLSAFKLIAGIIASSYAMISDAIHSASDVVSSVIVIVGVKIANKKSDKSHPYGHERFECIASLILASILVVTGLGIGISGVQNIFSGEYKNFEIPGLIALIAAVVSIIVILIDFIFLNQRIYKLQRIQNIISISISNSSISNIRSGAFNACITTSRSLYIIK